MLLNLIISTIFYTVMLALGHMLYFIDPIIYETILIYAFLLVIFMHLYEDNCKALELRDFFLCTLIVSCCLSYYAYRGGAINYDVAWFLYLAVFLPYVSFASGIRYRSLM